MASSAQYIVLRVRGETRNRQLLVVRVEPNIDWMNIGRYGRFIPEDRLVMAHVVYANTHTHGQNGCPCMCLAGHIVRALVGQRYVVASIYIMSERNRGVGRDARLSLLERRQYLCAAVCLIQNAGKRNIYTVDPPLILLRSGRVVGSAVFERGISCPICVRFTNVHPPRHQRGIRDIATTC